MKVLLTGGSSFTGTWFARALAKAGHEVIATLRTEEGSYTGTRGKRVALLREAGVQLIENCSFGDDRFIQTVNAGFDVLCHHAANVANYKSMDFDVQAAVADNARNARTVLSAAKAAGVGSIILTGSVFEQDEGAGNAPLRAFSPYGLSKGLTWQTFAYWAEITGLPLHKFVIPNPFGPYEEPRFCAYLLQKWVKGELAQVNTPAYVRDNIHVDLLAAAYVDFVAKAHAGNAPHRCNPSGYAETQGAFATRFAAEIGVRLGMETPLQLNAQTDFSEPFARINTDRVSLSWDEKSAWDGLAAYYRTTYLQPD